jgi:hypothetical protein
MAKSSRSDIPGGAAGIQTHNSRRHFSVTTCEELSIRLFKKNRQLFGWQERLDEYLENTDSDVGEVISLSALVENLKKDILQLQSEQRKLGCVVDEPEISYDNQTVISTGSVRRKDARALARNQFSTGGTNLG